MSCQVERVPHAGIHALPAGLATDMCCIAGEADLAPVIVWDLAAVDPKSRKPDRVANDQTRRLRPGDDGLGLVQRWRRRIFGQRGAALGNALIRAGRARASCGWQRTGGNETFSLIAAPCDKSHIRSPFLRLVVRPSSTPAGKATMSYASGPKPPSQPIAEFAMRRRSFLGAAGGLSASILLPGNARAQALQPGWVVVIRCLGNIEGPRWLDGRTADGTVGLAPDTHPPYTGARWQVVDAGGGAVALCCLGNIEGPRWLDGRTANGTVGLAPNLNLPYTGARWQVADGGAPSPSVVSATSRVPAGSMAAPRTERSVWPQILNLPYTGARWQIFRG